jgi:Protein of unknown function (DUF3341)
VNNTNTYGLLAQFESPEVLYLACEKLRDKGYQKWDAYSSFPIHGLHKAMGLSQSKLPWLVLAGALLGGGGGFSLWCWMSAVDYPMVIAGKPFFSWQAFFLPGFECAVLSAAICSFLGVFILNGLPQWYNPLFKSDVFMKATDDKFFICIEAEDPLFDEGKVKDFFKEVGASHWERVEN